MSKSHNYLSTAVQLIDTSEIRKVFDLAAKIENPINLSIGQPDFPVPEPVKEALIKAVKEDKNAYTQTQGILPLREAIAQFWENNDKVSIHPDNIVVSAGVASLLYLLFDVLFDKGDEILLSDPYFLIYEALAKYHQLKIHYINENFTEAHLFNLLEKNPDSKIKAFFFSTPSNPSGKIVTKEQTEALAKFSRKTGMLLISDEIYRSFDYDNKFVSTAAFCPENTITLGGFSKSHAMTGLRVGYMGAPESLSHILQKTAALQQYSIVCSPHPAQWAALTALSYPISNELEIMKKRRALVIKHLKGSINYNYPDGAFYIFPEIPQDSQKFVETAVKNRLLIVPGYIFSQNRKTIRISYAQKEEVLEEGLEIFKKLVHEC
ncbi:MAG: pyridoxal phosphate-dependent aminotransferase [Spirochaetia bacterium]|nr:pyridoxal phosphate-dependent aminotransferase [Spirochaetia bacterium]